MVRFRPLRGLAAVAMIGVLALLLQKPLCAPDVCPMGKARMAAPCGLLKADCCQAAGERAVDAPVQVPPLAATRFGNAANTANAASPAPEHGSPEPSAAPAILQGLGLYTLLAVFLI